MSPGPLSTPHHDLEGPLHCAKCHVFGAGSPQFRCLECHQEIARRLSEKHGYHAATVKQDLGSNDCVRCHSEHNGTNHRLVRWPVTRERFDHAQAGWKLEGRHGQLKCVECHTAKYIVPRDRAVLKRHDLNTAFAALDPSCTACHRDVHAGELGVQCVGCHSQESWKNPPGFSHERARYPLTGLHARVECGKCHRPAAAADAGTARYRGFAMFQLCESCHKDPHGNSFGGDCARCHLTTGWKRIVAGNGFDHSRTDYPLLGRHAAVACRDCHKTENFKTPVAFGRCLDCHQDRHGGQFAHREDGGDCKSCHDGAGWRPSLFTAAAHARSEYPLTEKHAVVVCAKCHLPRGKDTVYRVSFAACTDCHADRHNQQFALAPHNNHCQDCHDTGGWKPAAYTVAAHNQTAFALRGAHVAVPCSGCHRPRAGDVLYHPGAANCSDCHQSPHGTLAEALRCETCHSVASWRARGRFEHSRTAFALLGRHAAVDCLACHKPEGGTAVRTIAFRAAAKDCAGCHADPHAGQFRAAGNENGCQRCHTVLSWRPTEFDHSRHSTFRLDGAHEGVPCRMCHNQQRPATDGVSVVVYKGTPRECRQCHL
jgi:hypothetical protein